MDGTDLSDPLRGEPAFQGKYVFQGLIGSGGMGVIYKAHQLGIEKTVAIKMLHKHMVKPNAVSRFQIEGRAAGMLKHQYIVPVHDLGVTSAGQPYMIMDYVDGTTLEQILATTGQLSESQFFHLFPQVCDALSLAHKHGVLHRDVKPSNIMVVKNVDGIEEVRVMDFGVAKLLSDSESSSHNLTKTGETVGSPAYMSPEQGKGKEVDARSDLYSLGCVMYEALTGTPPFIGSSPLETILMHAKEPPLPLAEASLGGDIDPRTERIVLKLLEKEPKARYQTMDDLWADLRSLAASRTQPGQQANSKSVSKPGSARRPRQESSKQERKKAPVPIIATAAVALVLASLGLFFVMRNKQDRSPTAATTVPTTVTATQPTPTTGTAVEHSLPLNEHEEMRELVTYQLRRRREGGTLDLSGLSSDEYKTRPSLEDLAPLKSEEAITFVKSLTLPKLKMSDKEIEIIEHLKLKRLYLDGNSLIDLHAIKDMKSLTALSIEGNPVDKQGLSNIARLTNLTDLDLGATQVTDDDLCILNKLELQRLVLDHTLVSDLHEIKAMTSLVRLSLEGTHVGKAALEVAKGLPKLRQLNLNLTDITNADLGTLEEMTSLRRLDLQGCPNLTKEAISALRDHLPSGCRMTSNP
jgi:serine/threonine protein kinase